MKVTLTNRLAGLLRLMGVSSASEFARQMTAAGYPMSRAHASRYEKQVAPAFDIKFITAACNVLQCLPNDLYGIEIELDKDENIKHVVILPRHAIVTRNDKTSPTFMEMLATDLNEAAQQEKVTVVKPPKSKPKPVSKDIGPTGVLFPFIKESDEE